MSRQTINDMFSVSLPESFELMSAEDLSELSRNGGDPYLWGARDRENHVMIVALWKQYPAILARMTDLKTIAKRNEQLTRRVYEGHDYRFLGSSTLQAGVKKAEGYSFSYCSEGVVQVVNSYLIRDGKMIYTFLCNGREANNATNQAIFREMLEDLQVL